MEQTVVCWAYIANEKAQGLLQSAVATLASTDPDEIVISHLCPLCGSAHHGRPMVTSPIRLRQVSVSLSRTKGVAIAAASWLGQVGIDVEQRSSPIFHQDDFTKFPGIAQRLIAETAEPSQTWTRKEAVLKAHGMGLAIDPSLVGFSFPHHKASPERVIELPDELSSPLSETYIQDIQLTEQLAAAIAWVSAKEPEPPIIQHVDV